MLISEIIDYLRADLSDERGTRWTDPKMLLQILRAINRLGHVLYRNDIELGRQVYPFDTSPGQAVYPLPMDYMVDNGLWRLSTATQLKKESEASWHLLQGTPELKSYIIRGTDLILAGTPSSTETLELVYWPQVGIDPLTVEDETPWDGKLDFLIIEYAAYRMRNIDEMDQTPDSQILSDLENQILATYSAISPLTTSRPGWVV